MFKLSNNWKPIIMIVSGTLLFILEIISYQYKAVSWKGKTEVIVFLPAIVFSIWCLWFIINTNGKLRGIAQKIKKTLDTIFILILIGLFVIQIFTTPPLQEMFKLAILTLIGGYYISLGLISIFHPS